MPDKNKRKRSIYLLPLIFAVIIGMVMGILISLLENRFPGASEGIQGSLVGFIVFMGFFAILLLAGLVHIVLHEAGHLLFGLLSGYRFLSFRIGSFVLIRDQGQFKIRRFNIPGTAGQCLMIPPPMNDGNYPFVLYNLGGGLVNLLLGLPALFAGLFIPSIQYPFNIILVLFGAAGLFFGLTNLIPLRIGGIANDGANIRILKKDPLARRNFHLHLEVNRLLGQGVRLKDLDLQDFVLEEDADLASPFNTTMVLLQHQWHLDKMDFKEAASSLVLLDPVFDRLLPLHQFEIRLEKIFLDLISGNSDSIAGELLDKPLMTYVRTGRRMISKKRFLMAWEGLHKGDIQGAGRLYAELLLMADQHPLQGEAEMEVMLAEHLKDMLAGATLDEPLSD